MITLLLWILGCACSFASFVCFILVMVAMFKHNKSVLAIVCLVLICTGIGPLVALVLGFINGSEWGTKKVATLGLATMFLSWFLVGGAVVLAPATVQSNEAQRALEELENSLQDVDSPEIEFDLEGGSGELDIQIPDP